ncbi:TPA: hypothetical protein DDW35_08225 [Candidatus Sumerlaeota bacterium]|nr:hypothetical protein [Candidatus Sumerlaeota bacterium]
MADNDNQTTGDENGGNGKSNRFRNAIWISSVLAVVILGVFFLVYRMEIRGISRAFFTVHSVRLFVNNKAPALLKDFPFDAAKPPEFTAELFLRYCKARDTIGQNLKPLLDDLPLLDKMSITNSFSSLRTASVELTPVLNDVQSFFLSLEPILRENRLSVQQFRWVAIQSWGLTAQAIVQAGDPKASKEMQDESDHWERLLQGRQGNMTPVELSKAILKEIGTEFNVQNSEAAWQVMQQHWSIWADCETGPEVDVGMVRGWKELKSRMKTDPQSSSANGGK